MSDLEIQSLLDYIGDCLRDIADSLNDLVVLEQGKRKRELKEKSKGT